MPFPVFNLLYSYISTFRSMFAVPIVAVFCSSLTSCFPLTLLRYFVNYFEMLPVAPIITGITFVFTFHTRCISAVRSLYFTIFSVSFFITFLSPHIAVSIKPCFFFITTDYDVRFIVKDGSVSLCMLNPPSTFLTLLLLLLLLLLPGTIILLIFKYRFAVCSTAGCRLTVRTLVIFAQFPTKKQFRPSPTYAVFTLRKARSKSIFAHNVRTHKRMLLKLRLQHTGSWSAALWLPPPSPPVLSPSSVPQPLSSDFDLFPAWKNSERVSLFDIPPTPPFILQSLILREFDTACVW